MPDARCTNCDAEIRVDRPRQGDLIVCPECGVELEAVCIDPVEVDFPEDWQKE